MGLGPRSMLALVLALALPSGAAASALDAELSRCLEANAPREPRVLELRLTSEHPDAAARETRAVLTVAPSEAPGFRALLRVAAPEELRGTAVLWRETGPESVELFVYLPELERVRKLRRRHLKGRLFDSDVSYEDVERLVRAVRDASTARGEDGELDGRAVWVVEGGRPDDGAERVRSWVDRETCLPLRTELFDDRRVLKVVEVDPARIQRVGEGWLPGDVVVRDARTERETRLRLTRVEAAGELPSDFFEPGALGREAGSPR